MPHRLDIANEFAGQLRRTTPIRAPCSTARSVRWPRPKRATPLRAPKAAPKPWRCWSWRRNFCGDDHAIAPRTLAPRRAARLRHAVRLGLSAEAGAAEGRDPRFLTIILRGALDGLATVAPVGDPDWIALRGDNALTLDSKTPALGSTISSRSIRRCRNLHRMFQANEAIIVHACATPYRERSHFDGQDLLESGLPKPGVERQRLAQSRARQAWRRAAVSIRRAARFSRSVR